MLNPRFWWPMLSLGLLFVAQAGCERGERIAHYRVDKAPPIDAPRGIAEQPAADESPGEATDRMLGAIVPVGEKGWFFKVTGPKDVMAAKVNDFTTFVKSVHFSDQGQPEWTLPEGWQQQPGSGMRYSTITIPGGDKPLELSVITLPRASDDANYLLANINRWRGQMKLPPISQEQISGDTVEMKLEGASATIVDLLGTAAPNNMSRAPFFPGAGDGK